MLNKKLSVAIESLAYIATHSGEKAVSSKEICKALGLKLRYTEALMQKLVKAGILKGVRGASGGYFLARDRRSINVAEVYDIIKNLSKTKKLDESESVLAKLVVDINDRIEADLNKILTQITLEKIYNSAKKIKAPAGKNNKTDFII